MRAKLLAALALSVLIPALLASCGGGGSASSAGSASMPEEPAVSAVAPVETEPEPEPGPSHPFYHPLTGEGLEEDISQNRPVAIMVNNLKKALPQLGVSQADVIYELPAEGGITRMLALFQSVEGVGEIGSVRSARDYYVSIACGHDAIFLHAGGSPQAYSAIKSLGVTALDCVNGPYEGTLFWRDQERRKSMGLEHSVLTSGGVIQELLPTYSRVALEHEEGFEVGWRFGQDPPSAGFEPADQLTVKFSSYKTGVFTYDGETGLYLVEEYGAPYVDGNTGQQVAVKNVLVLYTDVSNIPGDTEGRLTVRTTGEGSGLMLWEGRLYPITWKRPAESDRFSFCLENGQEAVLSVGSSYINIVGLNAEVTWK